MGSSASKIVQADEETDPSPSSGGLNATYSYSTGETYYGGWEDNKREGVGTYLYVTGDAYWGHWHRNLKSGYGVYIKSNHIESYAGEWMNNSRNGRGCLIQKNGTRYIGSFKDDLRHGPGVSVRRNGQIFGEVWRHGQLVHRQYIFLCSESDLIMKGRSLSIDGPERVADNAPRASELLGGMIDQDEDQIDTNNLAIPSTSVDDEKDLLIERSHVCRTSGWSMDDVETLLKFAGLNILIPEFQDHSVSGESFLSLIDDSSFFWESHPRLLSSTEHKLVQSLIRVIVKMKHKCEVSTVISREVIQECYAELEVKYEEIDFDYECGRGGYGKVYKANWMHRAIACKVFKQTREAPDANYMSKDFWLEINALAKLRHPNITLLLGVCLQPRYCILTEFVACGSLFDLIHRRREIPNWGVARIINIGREICLGMTYLHTQGILHCDLKSSNILITESWGVKIADFGLSFLYPDSDAGRLENSSLSGDQSLLPDKIPLGCVGTHHWIAPEVLRGEEYSRAADVYSFGIIVWEMVHRKIPFQDLTAAQVIALVGYGSKKIQISSYCPSQIRNIIARCIAKDMRPSFDVLGEDLSDLHKRAVLEVEDRLDSFFGNTGNEQGIQPDFSRLSRAISPAEPRAPRQPNLGD
jgi:tRNA A-37 threonylcarbamoyl transferase component Bud32